MARGTWGGALDPNLFQVTIRMIVQGQHVQTGFKLRDAVTNDNSAQEVADEVDSVLRTTVKGLLTFADTIEMFDVIRMGSEEGGVKILTPSEGQGTETNSSGTAPLPSFVAANISLKSEIRKRYGQGRMFMPVVTEAWIDGNVLNNTGVTKMNGLVTAITDAFTGDPVTHDLILVTAHGPSAAAGVPGTPGFRPARVASWYDVVSVRVNTTLTSLKSRKLGNGN